MMSQDYTKYDAMELAADAWFIQWIVEGDPAANQFWQDWLKAHPDQQTVVDEARLLVKAISFKESPTDENTVQRLWQNIDTLTEDTPSPASQKGPAIMRWLGYAAAAASVALLIFFFGSGSDTTAMAEFAEKRNILLPDSSLVRLNAGTEISYNPKQWEKERIVQLEGEAFFEVKKGQTFSVTTVHGTVEVLGTSFNVNTHDGRFDIACYTGKVKVEHKKASNQPIILNPGDRARLDRLNQKMQADTFNVARKNWFEGNIEFESTALSDVFAEMERQFDVEIKVGTPRILQETYTGFLIEENLDSTLYAVCWPKGFSWEKISSRQIQIDE